MSEPRHRCGGEHVQHHFLGGAGFQARRAGQDFGADLRGDQDLGQARHRRTWVHRDCHGRRAAMPSVLQCCQHVWRGAARGDPHHDVVMRQFLRSQIALCIFH